MVSGLIASYVQKDKYWFPPVDLEGDEMPEDVFAFRNAVSAARVTVPLNKVPMRIAPERRFQSPADSLSEATARLQT